MELDFAPETFWLLPDLGDFGSVNIKTIIFSWVVIAVLILLSALVYTRLKKIPTRLQLLLETIVDGFDNLTRSTLGERGRAYLPYIGSLFLFIWFSNLIGIIPGCEEPTRDVNTTLGLGFCIVIPIAHISGIRVKGWRYLKEFFEPGLVIRGVWLPNIFMCPLNVVGEFGKAISLPFRLFGNIFGGAIIIVVLSQLARYAVLPPFLMFFFGIFVGTIQAFVFAMLALTYTAVAVAE